MHCQHGQRHRFCKFNFLPKILWTGQIKNWTLSVVVLFHNYWLRSLAKQGDNALGTVRPSVHLSVCPSVRLSVHLSIYAKENDYQSKMFVCVSTNRADAVDRLLILFYEGVHYDCEAIQSREIMYFVTSVCLSIHLHSHSWTILEQRIVITSEFFISTKFIWLFKYV